MAEVTEVMARKALGLSNPWVATAWLVALPTPLLARVRVAIGVLSLDSHRLDFASFLAPLTSLRRAVCAAHRFFPQLGNTESEPRVDPPRGCSGPTEFAPVLARLGRDHRLARARVLPIPIHSGKGGLEPTLAAITFVIWYLQHGDDKLNPNSGRFSLMHAREFNFSKRVQTTKGLRYCCVVWITLTISALLFTPAIYAGNEVMGEIQLEGKSNVEKTSGVWVDGEYVGYLKELKGSKKILLLPGEHSITVRQDGYQDFRKQVVVQPGEKQVVLVAMEKASTGPLPDVTSTVKIAVNPPRAAVFLDGMFVGHVGEFKGAGRGMLVSPGVHTIKIALPGYKTFETEINPQANQSVEVKTELVKDSVPVDDPSLKSDHPE